MSTSNTMEIDGSSYGIVMVGTKQEGEFQSLPNGTTDRWKWTGTPFPASGFSIAFQSSGSTSDPYTSYPDWPFLTSTTTPEQQWAGSKLYSISKNGTLVGWFEASTDTPAKLMWWSNGQSLINNRIAVRGGDTLAFAPASLPGQAQRPLQFPQLPV